MFPDNLARIFIAERLVSAAPSNITDEGNSQMEAWITDKGHLENRCAWGLL